MSGRRIAYWAVAAAVLLVLGPLLKAVAETSQHASSTIYLIAFPITFVTLWLVVCVGLSALSGWFGLMTRYPDRKEAALVTLGRQSASMGPIGVSLNGMLRLDACPSGLRVSMWRIFGPFSRPFFVPWREIRPEPSSSFFMDMVRLRFGNPEQLGTLKIHAGSWARLSESGARAAGAWTPELSSAPSNARLIRTLVLQWLATTCLAGSFFYYAPRMQGGAGPLMSPATCFVFPAVVFGIGALMRYSSLKR